MVLILKSIFLRTDRKKEAERPEQPTLKILASLLNSKQKTELKIQMHAKSTVEDNGP